MWLSRRGQVVTLPGLHVAALDFHDHPGAGSHLRLAIAALHAAIACLEESGEAGTGNAIRILRQQVDELEGPPLRELVDPEETARINLPQLYASGVRVYTMPYYGKRK